MKVWVFSSICLVPFCSFWSASGKAELVREGKNLQVYRCIRKHSFLSSPPLLTNCIFVIHIQEHEARIVCLGLILIDTVIGDTKLVGCFIVKCRCDLCAFRQDGCQCSPTLTDGYHLLVLRERHRKFDIAWVDVAMEEEESMAAKLMSLMSKSDKSTVDLWLNSIGPAEKSRFELEVNFEGEWLKSCREYVQAHSVRKAVINWSDSQSVSNGWRSKNSQNCFGYCNKILDRKCFL